MSYWEFQRQCRPSVRGFGGRFWEIVDSVWSPAEQNALAREWKEGTVT